eukprot:COSAG02_NODE_930_length_15835_cov_114.387201_1_plen_41_part_10
MAFDGAGGAASCCSDRGARAAAALLRAAGRCKVSWLPSSGA